MFKADIAENGQSETIKILDGKILDGRNRYRACCDLKIEPRTEVVETADPVAYVVSRNLHRRHLTESQRAMVGARIVKLHRPAAKARQSSGGKTGGATAGRGRKKKVDEDDNRVLANLPEPYPDTRNARDDAAAATNVSPRSVQSGFMVLENGIPELAALVDSGEVKVSAAAEVAALPWWRPIPLRSRVVGASVVGTRVRGSLVVARLARPRLVSNRSLDDRGCRPAEWHHVTGAGNMAAVGNDVLEPCMAFNTTHTPTVRLRRTVRRPTNPERCVLMTETDFDARSAYSMAKDIHPDAEALMDLLCRLANDARVLTPGTPGSQAGENLPFVPLALFQGYRCDGGNPAERFLPELEIAGVLRRQRGPMRVWPDGRVGVGEPALQMVDGVQLLMELW